MSDSEKFDLILTELKKLDTLERKFDTLEKKLDTHEKKIDALEKKFDILEEKVEKIDYDVHDLKYQLMKYVADLKGMDEMIFNELERVHEILYKHQKDKAIHTA